MNKKITIAGVAYSIYKGNFVKVTRSVSHGARVWAVCTREGGKLVRKYFPLPQVRAANEYARAKEAERVANGQFSIVRDADRVAVAVFRRWEMEHRLKGENVPGLGELVAEACARYDARMNMATWGEASADYLAHRLGKAGEKRAKIVRMLVAKFTERTDSGRLMDDFTADDVRGIVDDIVGASARDTTRGSYLRILSAIWKHTQERGLARLNPAAEAVKRMPTEKVEASTFLPVEDCRKVLRAAAEWHDKADALFFVIGLLTGIRSAERARLQWRDFRLDEREPYINLPARKTKTQRQRAVYLLGTHADIIRAFMPAERDPDALIVSWPADDSSQRWRAFRIQEQLVKVSGVTMPRNVLRHTAATYLCAHLESAGKAALIMGRSETMLAKHYRALATKAEGDAFFALTLDK